MKLITIPLKVLIILLALYGGYGAIMLVSRITRVTAPASEKTVGKKNSVPVVILGSGPAGLVAAKTILDEGIPVTILEGKQAGGPLNAWTPVGNWTTTGTTSGNLIISDLRSQVEAFKDARFIARSVEKVDFSGDRRLLTLDNGEKVQAQAVIIAMGTSPRRLTIPGAQELAQAISYEQSPPSSQKGGRTLVLGGGIDALVKAVYRVRQGNQVTLVTRNSRLHAPAQMLTAVNDFVKKGSLTILYKREATELLGKNGKLTGVRLSDGNILPIDHVAVGIGRVPNTQLFASELELSKDGSISLKDHSQATSRSGVFAAGDITGGAYAESLIAAGDGMKAAKDVIRFLEKLQAPSSR